MMRNRLYILTFLVLLVSLQVSGQKAQFTASAPATVQLGQQFQYIIEGNERGNISLPSMDNFDLLGGPFSSLSSSTQWVNGKMTASTRATYTYVFRAKKAGNMSMPPAVVRVKKNEYKTNEVSINVIGSSTSESNTVVGASKVSSQGNTQTPAVSAPVYLKIIPSKREVFVGEQFVSELKIYTRVNTRPSGGLKDMPYEGFYKHLIDPDQTSQREMIKGESYVTQVLQRHVLIPQKSGKIVIEPFGSEWTIPQEVQRNRSRNAFDNFFSDPFFNSVQNVPTEIYTKPVAIKVKPFPAGAPEGFTGAVGSFKMTAKLSNDKIVENDALSMIISVSGSGNISLLGIPVVDFPLDHDVYEPSRKEKISTSGNRISGTVTFEYPMVARHAGSFRISPVKFSWFDPLAKKYKTIETEEFTFVVEKGESDDDNGQIYVSGLRAESVEDIGTDILDIDRNSLDLTKIAYSPLNKPWYWMLYLISAIVFILFGGLLRIYFKQRADVRLTRNRKANRLAIGRLKKADKARKSGKSELFFEETEKAIWGYLGDKLGLELSSLSKEKVVEVLDNTNVSEEDKSELFRIMEDCEFSRYAPSQEKGNMDNLYMESIKLIKRLEQNIQ